MSLPDTLKVIGTTPDGLSRTVTVSKLELLEVLQDNGGYVDDSFFVENEGDSVPVDVPGKYLVVKI